MFPAADDTKGLVPALERVCQEAADAATQDYTVIVLSDKKAGSQFVPIRWVLCDTPLI